MEDLYPGTRRFIDKVLRFLKRHPRLEDKFRSFCRAHERWAGFREIGLMRDDIISEEPEIIREALKRLTDKQAFDRTFRLRRAIQLFMREETLPKEEQLPPEKVKYVPF